MQKKKGKLILDTRDLKILSVKRPEFKEAVVFLMGNKNIDKSALMKLAEHLQNMEPDSIYFPVSSEVDIQIYDMNDLKHRDLLITVKPVHGFDASKAEEQVKKAIPKAKSITFVYGDVDIKRK
jgi:hypothetical protein